MNNLSFVTEYEYATILLISALIFLYLVRRRLETLTSRLVFGMMVLTFLSSFFHILTTKTLPHAQDFPVWFNYFIHIAYLLFYVYISILYLVYMGVLFGRSTIPRGQKIFNFTILALVTIPTVTTPWTHLVIWFDKDMNYIHGPLFYLLPGVALYVVIYSVTKLVLNRGLIKHHQRAFIISYDVFAVVATIIQLFKSEQIIGNFAVALGLLVAYLTIDNPANYIDPATDFGNSDAFYTEIDNYIKQDRRFTVIAFKLRGLDDVAEMMGVTKKQTIRQNFALNFRMAMYPNSSVANEIYALGDFEFAFLFDARKRILGDVECINKMRDFFASPVDFGIISTKVRPLICNLTYPSFVNSAEDVRDAIEYTLKANLESRSKIVTATEKSIKAKQRETQILALIRKYIDENLFEMYYQPIYNVKEKRFNSAEALIRMKDEEMGFISPEEFIPLAETNGLILDVGAQSFRKVCQFLKSNDSKNLGIEYIEVNLSTIQCMQENMAGNLIDIMDEHGIPHQMINFEITETAGFTNYDVLLTNLNRLIKESSSCSMDDYGTGFSTANYLITLPVEIVKIDKSILWPAMEDKNAFTILKYTVEMLKNLGKKIVVEGVETKEMVDVLTEIGVDYLQGYYFSRPLPATEYREFLVDNNK